MASTQLNDTQGTPTNAIKYTLSMWAKRSNEGADSNYLASVWVDGSNHWCMRFITDQLDIYDNISGSTTTELKTTRKFRDPAAWYHIVYVYDSANATAGNRQRLYVNGVEETSFAIDTNPGSSAASVLNVSGRVLTFGARNNASYFDGEMAHVHFCDGQAYAASDFGETDSTSGIWVAKTSPSVTYGNNGFFLKFASGASGTDSSGNSNDFAVTGTLTNLKDNPDNNFATMNSLDNYYQQSNFSNGNNTVEITQPSGNHGYCSSTMGVAAGLWYFEAKPTTGTDRAVGFVDILQPDSSENMGQGGTGSTFCFRHNGQTKQGGSSSAYGSAYSTNDIIGVYLDLTANKAYFSINGTLQNSGTGLSITAADSTTTGYYKPGADSTNGSDTTWQFNFGNGYFGTTAVASGVADDGGEGTFEYDPSSGTFDGSSKDFRAICTNNIATYGG